MAINPQSVMSSLRMMSDQQLQQYAAMHKNDPFVFPLAFQESQTRKQMRAEQQAAQAAPQGKVADQALAAMAPEPLPEEVGIGALPAQNMEGMAAGGIVAFDEGGEVPRFNGTAGSFVGPQFGLPELLKQLGITTQEFLASTPDQQKAIREMAASAGGQPSSTPAAAAAPSATAARAPTMTERGISAIGRAASGAGDYLKRGLGGLGKVAPGFAIAEGLFGPPPEEYLERKRREEALARATKAGEAFDPTTMASIGAGAKDLPAMPANKDVFGGTGATGAGGADQGGKTPPPALPKAPTVAPTTFKPAEAPSLASAKELAGQLLDTGAYKKSIEDYQKAEQDAVDAARLARKEGKPQGKAYEEYEKTLRDETADLGKQKGEAQGEAWLTAGLAVLGGSSPFALQNLGLATKGVEQYRDAMKDIRKATRENAKGLADIAQARRAEERGDWEKTQEFEERASTRMSNARKFGVEGIMGLGVKNAELAGRAYDTQVTQAGMDRRTFAELQSRERIANAQLAAPGAQERFFTTLGTDPTGAAAKGLAAYASTMGPEARGIQGLLAKYADPVKLMTLKNTDPDLYNYVRAQLSMQMMPGVMSKPTGAVRD